MKPDLEGWGCPGQLLATTEAPQEKRDKQTWTRPQISMDNENSQIQIEYNDKKQRIFWGSKQSCKWLIE